MAVSPPADVVLAEPDMIATEDEILSAVIEFTEKLNNTWKKRKDEDSLQKNFWRNFNKYNYRNIKKIHKESQVSYIFLKGLE